MKTQELLQLLELNQDKALLFEYQPNLFVGANYHITEVKHTAIDSVDCGAQMDSWNETIVQLWESPSEIGKTDYMSTYKALGIFKKVGRMKPYNMDSEVKFEYGNVSFHTAQLFVTDYKIENKQLVFKLAVKKTDCKAKEACKIDERTEVVADVSCCAPGTDCC